MVNIENDLNLNVKFLGKFEVGLSSMKFSRTLGSLIFDDMLALKESINCF